jgi:hypothetical protein
MYRTCIYCSADLGTNEALEAFPVGRSLAFDAWKGRLWAICPKCARWNLSPLEERWEAVEGAERLFADARLRVQSENVGLAKLRDGTRLIRVGEALPGELAAWRYGGQLVRRRRNYLIAAGAIGVGSLAVVGGASMLIGTGGLWGLSQLGFRLWGAHQKRKVIFRLPAERSPTGQPLALRRWQAGAGALSAAEGGIQLSLPVEKPGPPKPSLPLEESRPPTARNWWEPLDPAPAAPVAPVPQVVLPDEHARAFLGRAMVHVNEQGASRRRVQDAVALLAGAGSAEDFIRRTADAGRTLGERPDLPGQALPSEGALALEMALHEEAERRALEGELALLESAWREAEEIAAIADRLAVPAPGGGEA